MPIMHNSIQYPHCDPRILHMPGECEVCDLHPEWQQIRYDQRVNFTGHYDAGKMKCPAEQARGLESINALPNNRKKPNVRDAIKAIWKKHLWANAQFFDAIVTELLEQFDVYSKEGNGA